MKVTYQTCCGVDVHKSFLVATIVKTTGGIEPSYQKKRFSPLTIQFLNSSNGFSTMIAMISAWNPQVNTGFLSLIFWKMISMLSLPILKWVKAVKGNKDDTKFLPFK